MQNNVFVGHNSAHWQMCASRGAENQTLKQSDGSALLAFSNHRHNHNPWHVRVFFARLRRRDKTLIRHNQSSQSQIMPIFDTICLPISVLSSDFTLALWDGCAAMSVATEAAGVTVPADLPVKCSWALRDPGSHGSQQHHPWDAGLVSDLMTSNQQSCSLSPKTFLNTTFKKKKKKEQKKSRESFYWPLNWTVPSYSPAGFMQLMSGQVCDTAPP